jgi:hypothetical protein
MDPTKIQNECPTAETNLGAAAWWWSRFSYSPASTSETIDHAEYKWPLSFGTISQGIHEYLYCQLIGRVEREWLRRAASGCEHCHCGRFGFGGFVSQHNSNHNGRCAQAEFYILIDPIIWIMLWNLSIFFKTHRRLSLPGLVSSPPPGRSRSSRCGAASLKVSNNEMILAFK